jgi:signal peptidase I
MGRLIGLGSTLCSCAIWLVLGIALGLAVATTAPSLFDYRTFNVLTGSMEPGIGVGAVVVDEPIRPDEARPGQVVTFPDPSNHSRLLTHRVQSMSVRDGRAYVVTKGDANDAVERWNVPVSDEIGRVAFVAPKLGYARQWAAGLGGRIVVVVAVALWGLAALRDIWRPRPGPETAAGGTAA